MKNIHILPTDKPSRLHLWTDENGIRPALCELEYSHTRNTQHIYITSDKEIKANVYALVNEVLCKTEIKEGKIVSRQLTGGATMDICKSEYSEIILTDNEDLIKDGVQAIDEEFLEWFVKNPSCYRIDFVLINDIEPWYKIIIPQEEPKQHLEFINSNIEEFEGKLKEFKQEQKQYLIDIMRGDEELGLYNELYNEPKQETIEETALRLFPKFISDPYNPSEDLNKEERNIWIEGAKYQAKRSYSEEEVRKLLETQRGNCYVAVLTKTKDEELAAIAGGAPEPSGYNGWVKQFKK
jgi:hypothetical protein